MSSQDALLSEVRANFPIATTIKAADGVWSGDRARNYTNVSTELVHRGGGAGLSVGAHGGGGGGGHGKKQRTTSHHGADAYGGNKSGGDKSGGDKSGGDKSGGEATSGHVKKSSRGGKHRNRNRHSTSGGNETEAIRSEIQELHAENAEIKKEIAELREIVRKLGGTTLTDGSTTKSASGSKAGSVPPPKDEKAKKVADEDFDLFDSESEDDAEKERVKEERLKAYAEKKTKKPGPIAKSSIIFDVKPWDDEVDLKALEVKIRAEVQMDGLVWGASKILPIAFGINKLQIICIVEDSKVSSDDLEESIVGYEELVQSVDIVAFNKI